MFAMKVIRKEYTVKKEQGKHTVQERRMIMQDNPSNLKSLFTYYQFSIIYFVHSINEINSPPR